MKTTGLGGVQNVVRIGAFPAKGGAKFKTRPGR